MEFKIGNWMWTSIDFVLVLGKKLVDLYYNN